MLEELFAREVLLADPLLGEASHHLGFRSDGSVVGAGHPEGILAKHPRAADEHVLQGVVHHVAHMEHARHVRRRDHDGIGFAVVGFGMEEVMVQPVAVPFVLGL